MIVKVFEHLMSALKTAGCKNAYDDPAKLKQHKVYPCAVIQAGPEKDTFDGSVYEKQDETTGEWSIYRKRYDRAVPLMVHIAGRNRTETKTVLDAFLKEIGRGCYDSEGLWVGLEVEEVVREIEQSLIKDAVFVEVTLKATGGLWIKETVGAIPSVDIQDINLTVKGG